MMQLHVEFRHKSYEFLKTADNAKQTIGGYTCLVKKIEFRDPASKRICILGEHLNNETDDDVVGFTIRNEPNLKIFPGDVGRKFPNLKYFEINNCSVKTLEKDDLLNLGHLQGLWMPRNQIVQLHSNLFVDVQGLRFLSFHQNKLKYIGADILKPLKSLQRVNFRENTTIDVSYDGGEQELAALNKDFAIKCPFPTSHESNGSGSNKIVELDKRIDILELKCRGLEAENKIQKAQLAQVAALSNMVDALQSRMDVFESLMN